LQTPVHGFENWVEIVNVETNQLDTIGGVQQVQEKVLVASLQIIPKLTLDLFVIVLQGDGDEEQAEKKYHQNLQLFEIVAYEPRTENRQDVKSFMNENTQGCDRQGVVVLGSQIATIEQVIKV
jgi:hypothetical protein